MILSRWIGVGIFSLGAIGCVSANYPGSPTPRELVGDLYVAQPHSRARPQMAEEPIMLAQAQPLLPGVLPPAAPLAPPAPPPPPTRPVTIPTAPPQSSTVAIPAPPPGIGSGAQQASLKSVRTARTSVRAWVNGRPIFDDEVLLQLEMQNASVIRDPSGEKLTQAFNATLTNIIEMEIAYQDAVKKLEKGNPRALEKLKELVEHEYDKQTRSLKKALPADKFNELAPTFRRQLERQFIGMEYIRSRIFPTVNSIGHQEIKDYYDAHLNEFQKIESVKWQHIFLAVNAQRPSVAAVRSVAESLIQQVRGGAEFATLLRYDDGDSKSRGGLGFGTRKGEIKPAELEQYLFKMQAGQVGPIIEVSTGVHLFRLIERDPGGQMPLDETVQNQIRNKLKSQIFERELKRLVRELKTRAVVEIERGV